MPAAITPPLTPGAVGTGTGINPSNLGGLGNFIPNLPTPNMTPTNYSSTIGGNIGQTGSNYTGGGNTRNQFTAGQEMLQGLLPGMLANTLQGGEIPPYFTAPQQVFDVANRNFDTYVKPGLALQYGAGSPQIGSQQTQMNENLAANLYQSGMQNFSNLLGQGLGAAYNPVGATNTNQSTQNTDTMAASGSTSITGQNASLFELIKKTLGMT